jgi:hypothetical protein
MLMGGGITGMSGFAVAGNVSGTESAPCAEEAQAVLAALGASEQFLIPPGGAAFGPQGLVQQPPSLRLPRRGIFGARYVLEGIVPHPRCSQFHNTVAGDGWRCRGVATHAGDNAVHDLGAQRR